MNYAWICREDGSRWLREEGGGGMREISPAQEDFRLWLAAGGVPEEVPYVPPAPPSLDAVKERRLVELASARYSAETGGVTVAGVPIRTDRESQALITGAALKAMQDSTYVCKWKGADGWVTLDAAAILAVADAVRQHVQGCFDREAELSAQVDAAETVEAVEAVRWDA